MRVFLSGGTTGKARVVRREIGDWRQSVHDTTEVLRALGVVEDEVVIIGLPGYPWDVGEVFASAAESCGAEVWCLGSAFDHTQVRDLWLSLRPRFLIVPPRRLHSLGRTTSLSGAVLIAVGEPVSPELEAALIEQHGLAQVRRIYGHSELGTLAYQHIDKTSEMRVNPRFAFKLSASGSLLVCGGAGTFSIDTGDLAQITLLGSSEHGLWSASPTIKLLSRNLNHHFVGSLKLSELSIENFRSAIGAQFVQVEIANTNIGIPSLIVRVVEARCDSTEKMRTALSQQLLDLHDETGMSKCDHDVSVTFHQCDFQQLKSTPRGKTPVIIGVEPVTL